MKCPECNCEDIAITVQYRKSTLFRILKFFCIIAIFVTIISNMAEIIQLNELEQTTYIPSVSTQIMSVTVTPDNTPAGYASPITPTICFLIVFTIALIFCEIMQQWIESKKRVYYVCKQCNKIWFTQDTIE